MATTIKSNNPNIDSDRVFSDLDLNFGIHPIRKDINRHLNEQAIINSIKNLVLTNFYEKPFQPEIGSGIRNLLFENVDPLINAQLERAIEETIRNYEPRVDVLDIKAIASPDENGYSISLTFFIINNSNPITIDFFLERVR